MNFNTGEKKAADFGIVQQKGLNRKVGSEMVQDIARTRLKTLPAHLRLGEGQLKALAAGLYRSATM